MSIHPMTPADAAWFHMDGPANLAIVTGLLVTVILAVALVTMAVR